MKPTLKKVNNKNMSKIRQDLVFEKIGYDWANKKCIMSMDIIILFAISLKILK